MTFYDRFVRWHKAGVREWIMAAVTKACEGGIRMIDTMSVCVHRSATVALVAVSES